ncbi:FecR family protein [Sphingobacterium puteale]|uniref:FecR family protein n=1 Tax=Sphingobacterium puteale TaxID=2420510 RepID=UPI003D96F431
MDNERLQYLLVRVRSSSCSEEEMAELNEWYEQLDDGPEQLKDWIEEAGGKEKLVDQLYANFSKKIAKPRNRSVASITRLSVAATIAFLLGAALLYYKFQNESIPDRSGMAQSKIQSDTNISKLTLADGTKINLDDAAIGELYHKDGLSISKTDSNSLTYRSTVALKPVTDPKMQFNTLDIPRGGQYKISLPDGTKIWMNSASTLRFPVTSNGRDRLVSLTGEGYFEVAHNKELPFKVITGDQQIKVLGTHFNVKGYPDEKLISTTLLEGSVRVSRYSSGESKLMIPGQQANLFQNSSHIALTKANINQVVAWKNGYFTFDNESIENIMNTISRWYNVDVVYVGKQSGERFGGSFSRKSDLAEILHNLEELGNLRFRIKEQKVIVSGTSEQ